MSSVRVYLRCGTQGKHGRLQCKIQLSFFARYSARHCPEQHRKHLVNSRRFKYISAAVCSALGRLLSWKSFFQSFPKNAQMLASFTGTLERTPQFSRVMFAYTHTPMLTSGEKIHQHWAGALKKTYSVLQPLLSYTYIVEGLRLRMQFKYSAGVFELLNRIVPSCLVGSGSASLGTWRAWNFVLFLWLGHALGWDTVSQQVCRQQCHQATILESRNSALLAVGGH